MDTKVLVYAVGAGLVLLVGLLNFIEARRTRRVVEAAIGPERGRGLLGETMGFERRPAIVAFLPDVPGSAQGTTAPTEPAQPEAPPSCDTAREHRVPPRADLEALGRDLDAADQAQADQAPEPPAESGAHVHVAPPASAPVLVPGPAMVAAGLGERPEGARSSRPAPPKPPQPVRRPTLLGINPPRSGPPTTSSPPAAAPPEAAPPAKHAPVAPQLPRAAEPGDFDDEDEVTRAAPRPSAAQLAGASPGARTLPSMPAVAPSSRPMPAVEIITAGQSVAGASADESANTVRQNNGPARE
jgi:hypothetical protein